MKLCSKCIEFVQKATGYTAYEDAPVVRDAYPSGLPDNGRWITPALESDCEFWAHKALNKLEVGIPGIIDLYAQVKVRFPEAHKHMKEDIAGAFELVKK